MNSEMKDYVAKALNVDMGDVPEGMPEVIVALVDRVTELQFSIGRMADDNEMLAGDLIAYKERIDKEDNRVTLLRAELEDAKHEVDLFRRDLMTAYKERRDNEGNRVEGLLMNNTVLRAQLDDAEQEADLLRRAVSKLVSQQVLKAQADKVEKILKEAGHAGSK